MGKRTEKVIQNVGNARGYAGDAHEAMLASEDVLTELEDRQSRRNARRSTKPEQTARRVLGN